MQTHLVPKNNASKSCRNFNINYSSQVTGRIDDRLKGLGYVRRTTAAELEAKPIQTKPKLSHTEKGRTETEDLIWLSQTQTSAPWAW